MKHLMISCIAAVALASPAAAQFYDSTVVDSVRILEPRDESRLNDRGVAVQRRIVDLGFFQWPVPAAKGRIDPASRPADVNDCGGHDPEYRPAYDVEIGDDPDELEMARSIAFIYEWQAYRNAIVAADCTCGPLRADWSDAVRTYDQLDDEISERSIQTTQLYRLQRMIQADYKRMCDVRMTLDLG